jgi:dynein heavy chain
VLLDFER